MANSRNFERSRKETDVFYAYDLEARRHRDGRRDVIKRAEQVLDANDDDLLTLCGRRITPDVSKPARKSPEIIRVFTNGGRVVHMEIVHTGQTAHIVPIGKLFS